MRLCGRAFTIVMLLVTTAIGVGVGLPAAAQDATPAASPAGSPVASPVGLDGEAGWRVAEERPLEVNGEPATLSPDGEWLAGLGSAREFCVWAIETLEAPCAREELSIREETIVWAPDSSAVAFALNAATQLIDSDIYVFEVGAGELHNLTDDGLEDIDLLGGEEGDEPYLIDDVPAWSPDSQSLVFARTRWVQEGQPTTTMVRIAREGGETDRLFSVA
ncbi:MAG: hypothetical protein M3121_07770, partial [Chloroflexota bacterium]|nr:hypothetical protein [Chloroflexota bacterium]